VKRLVYTLMLMLTSTSLWASDQDYNHYMAPPRNMGPILDLREHNPDCATLPLFSFFQVKISSAVNAIADELAGLQLSWWPDLTDHTQTPDEVYNGVSYDRYNSKVDTELIPSNISSRDPLHISLDTDNLEALKANKFLDHLGRNLTLRPRDILQLVDSEETCETALTYLNKEFDVKGMDFSGCNPLVLPGLIYYIKDNAESFKNLSILLCRGHNLNAQQVIDLLKIMGERSAPDTKIDLTPGPETNKVLLVGLAARFANKYPKMTIIISDISLPEGFTDYDFPANFDIRIGETIKSDKAAKLYKYMSRIIEQDAIEITYEEGKTIILEN